MMRIITGKARGVRLQTLTGEATRPTSERAKEAVFSILQFELRDAHVLDLFAGSGQMGLEAVSRGARRTVLCDASGDAIAVIRENVKRTRLEEACEIIRMEHSAYLRTARVSSPFDLVFLDPPYALGLIPSSLRMLSERGLLAENAKLICESADPSDVFGTDADLASRFEVLKQNRYGAARITVLRYIGKQREVEE